MHLKMWLNLCTFEAEIKSVHLKLKISAHLNLKNGYHRDCRTGPSDKPCSGVWHQLLWLLDIWVYCCCIAQIIITFIWNLIRVLFVYTRKNYFAPQTTADCFYFDRNITPISLRNKMLFRLVGAICQSAEHGW